MEALLLQDAAYVRERYAELPEGKQSDRVRIADVAYVDCVSGRKLSHDERLGLERRRIVQRARALDAKGPTPQFHKKLIVLQDILERLYKTKEDVSVPSPSKKRLETRDANAPVPLKELPIPTQVVLKMFFRMCQTLRDASKLAGNYRPAVQIASKLPMIVMSMPSCVLSPGLVDDASVELEDGTAWSVFYQLFRLFEELLDLDGSSVTAAPCLSTSDRATVVVAYVALSLKWGRLGFLLKGVKLLLESGDEINGARLEPLFPLFRELAATTVERPQIVFGEEAQSCGYLMSFGKGDHGKLGHGQCAHVGCQEGNCTENKTAPTMIAATRDVLFRNIDSLSTHSIAITAKGEAMAWGNGDKYRLGHGSSAKEYTPRIIEFLRMKGPVRDLACGLGHTLALTESGELFAWGNGSNGRLGLGDTNDRSSPTKVTIPTSPETPELGKEEVTGPNTTSSAAVRFRHIFCGASHSLGISWDGKAYAWGKNNQGQCGHGHTNDQLTIQQIESFHDNDEKECVVFAAGGWEHTLFCTGSGRVYSCGCGYKDSRRAGIPPVLGHGDCDRRLKPTLVEALEDAREEIVKVACGWDHSLAVSASGKVYTWGSGTNGKLGHGDEESIDIPTIVRSLEGKRVKEAKAGCEHTVFLTHDQELWTCGQGDSGRLGHGDNQTRKHPTKIELFGECGLKPVALAVGDKYNLILVKDNAEEFEDGAESNSLQKTVHQVGNGMHEKLPIHGATNAQSGHHRSVHHNECEDSHAMKFGAQWVLNIAAGLEPKGHPEIRTTSTPKEDIMPDSSSIAAVFITGHLDRLASDYIAEEYGTKEEKQHQPTKTELNPKDELVLIPFAADTSCESLEALLLLLRLTTSFEGVKDKSAQCEKYGSNVPSTCLRLANRERMGLTLSCLRILQLNLKKSLNSVSVMTRTFGTVDKTFSKRSKLFSNIHELLDTLGGLKEDELVSRLYDGARQIGEKQDVRAATCAISQEAACALKMGFGMFYPTGPSRCNLLREVLNDCKVDVPSMRRIILSDQLCKDSIMTEVLSLFSLTGGAPPGESQNESSSEMGIFEIKSLMIVLLRRSSAEATKHLGDEAFTDFTNGPDCFLRLLHVLQTHYFSIVHQSAFRQFRIHGTCSLENQGPATSNGSHQIMESLLEYVDTLLVESLAVLKRLHKGSRQHEEIITWRLNGSFFHTVLPSALECLSVLLLSKPNQEADFMFRATDNLLLVERVLPNLIAMVKMLDEVSWKMQSAGGGGNQHHDDSTSALLHCPGSISQERNWFVDLGDACAVLCGKLSCELLYPSTLSNVFRQGTAQYGVYHTLIVSEGRPFQPNQDAQSKALCVSSSPIHTILEWEPMGVFEVEDELVGCKEESSKTGSTESMSPSIFENQRFLLQLNETDFPQKTLSFWDWIASTMSRGVDVTGEVQRLLVAIVSITSWHLDLTEELRHSYEDKLSLSPSDNLGQVFSILLEYSTNTELASIDLEATAKQTRLLLSLRPNPALVPHELRCGTNPIATYSCTPRMQASILNLFAFVTKPVNTDLIRRSLFKKEQNGSLVRTGICVLHDLLRKLTTSSTKSCLLDEFVNVGCATNFHMSSAPVASARKVDLNYDQDKGVDKAIENLFVRLARIIASEDGSFELKKKALLAWTIPLGYTTQNVSRMVALIAKSGIMSTLVDLLLDEANLLETVKNLNLSVATENHVGIPMGGEMCSNYPAGAESRLQKKIAPVNALLFGQTPDQIIRVLAWEAFCGISMQLRESEKYAQHKPNLFVRSAGPSLQDKEPLTPRSMSMSPRRRLTLPKKMVVSTVDEIIEQMIDGLFLLLKGVRYRLETLDVSSQEYATLLRDDKSFQQQPQESQVYLFGHPVQISETNTHDITITTTKHAGTTATGLTLSFWLYIENTAATDISSGITPTSAIPRSNKSSPQLFAFTRNQASSMATDSTDAYKGPELIVYTHDAHPDHISIGLSLRCYEKSTKESWCSIVVDERITRDQWIQVVCVFNKNPTDLLHVFVGGKHSTLNNGLRTVDKPFFSELSEMFSSWDTMTVGGNVNMESLCIQNDVITSNTTNNQQLPELPKRSSHFSFAAVLDDVIMSRSAVMNEMVCRMQNSGGTLFRLKQQYIAENNRGKILRLLCQLVVEGEPISGEPTLARLPFSDRWVTLLSSMLFSTSYDQDLAQVYLCYLLQDVLPRAPPLPEFDIQRLGQRLFSVRPSRGTMVEQLFNEFNEQNCVPSSSTIRTQNETLYRAMQQVGILHQSSRVEKGSDRGILSDGADLDVLPFNTMTSIRFAAGAHLLQNLCNAPSWRSHMEQFIENSIAMIHGSERLKYTLQESGGSSFPNFADLFAAINTMVGYSEEALNDQRASVRHTAIFSSQIQTCRAPLDSVIRLDDKSFDFVAKVQALVCGMLNEEIGRTLSLPARKDVLAKCNNDVTAVSVVDLRIASVLHLRAQVLRILVATLLRENYLATSSKPWHLRFLEDTAACEDLLQVASSCAKASVTTTLGPDSKLAMKLRRVRIFNKEVLRGRKHCRDTIPRVSLAELERLQWVLWEEIHSLPPSLADFPWWQQMNDPRAKLTLEVVGGDVELCDLKVKALEHFPTVRLAQTNICAKSGLWFFEVVVLTDGLMQIGYVDGDVTADPLQGQGVGDHNNSWAFDGFRCKKWNVNSYDYGEQWRADDVVGVLLDTDRMEISYFLNGKCLGIAFSGIPITASSCMCPAASLNVHQSAKFYFGAPGIASASEASPQPLCLGGFKHLPALSTEDQARLRPIILALQTRGVSNTACISNVEVLEKEETKVIDISEHWSSSSDSDSDTDDGEILMDSSGNQSVLRRTLERGSRSDQEARLTDLSNEESGQRRRDLIEGLTGLGLPLEWAARCATETRLPMDETGAVAWILEQMEKVGLDGATSLPLNSAINDDANEIRGHLSPLWSTQVQLPSLVDSEFADDVAAEPSLLAVPNPLERNDNTELRLSSALKIDQISGIPVLQQLGTSERQTTISATGNIFIEGDKDDAQSDGAGNEAFQQNWYHQQQTNLATMLHFSGETHLSSSSKSEKQVLTTKRSADDLLPLGTAVDTTVCIAYARQAFTSLLVLALHQDYQGAVYTFVRRLVLTDESSTRMYRFLRIAIGLDTMDAASQLGYITDNAPSGGSLQIQKTMTTLLQYEHVVFETESTDSRSPLLKSLCEEVKKQCDEGLSLVRSKRTNKTASDSLAVNSAAAWFAWLSSLVVVFVEGQLVKVDARISDVSVPLFQSTSFVENLITLASSSSNSAMPWKYVAFHLMSRIMFLVRKFESNRLGSSGDQPLSNLCSTALFISAQLHHLVELFALRHRREIYNSVFFSDITDILFALLVGSSASIDRLANLKTIHNYEKRCINLQVCKYSSTQVSISWEPTTRSMTPALSTENSADPFSSCISETKDEVDPGIVFLKVKRCGPNLGGRDLSDACDSISSKALPSKGTFTVRNLLPDTQYILQVAPVQAVEGGDSDVDAVYGAEVLIQTPPEPVFELDEDTMGENLVVFDRNLSAKNTANKKWHSVRASVAFEEGIHQWQVRLDICVSKNIFIGVCTAEANMENYIGSDAYGYGFLANKAVWHNKAKLQSYGEIFKQGDVIQVTLNCNAKTLAFSRNGEYLGIAASDMRAGVGGSTGTDGACKWYPAFSLYNKDDKVTLVPPPAASICSSQEGHPQNASTFELIEAMQDVFTYHQLAIMTSNEKVESSKLYEKAFQEFEGWRREKQIFREISLGQVVAIDKSKSATDRYGLAAGDSVFTSKGQCTVLGEYRHELWYEVDEGGSSSLSSTATPPIASWNLSACREMLSSPDEYPVHRHHTHKFNLDSTGIDSDTINSTIEQQCSMDSSIDHESFSLQVFVNAQEHWADNGIEPAEMDAKLIAELDAIATSQASSSPLFLSFSDVSASLLFEKMNDVPRTSPEYKSNQRIARIGLLLYVNRCLYHVVRLAVPRNTFATSLGTDTSYNAITNQQDSNKKVPVLCNTEHHQISPIAALLNSPHWAIANPSIFTRIPALASRLLFSSQKDKLIEEELGRTKTASRPAENLQEPSDNDDSSGNADLLTVRICYPVSLSVPFWEFSIAVPKQRHFYMPSTAGESIFLQLSKQLSTQDARQWRRESSLRFEAIPISQSFQLHIEKTVAASCDTATKDGKSSSTVQQQQDGDEDDQLQDPSSKQTANYLLLFESVAREIQSPRFPLFVPDRAQKGVLESVECQELQLDVNVELFSPSALAHAHIRSSQLLMWYFCFGQILGIAWRSKLLLPLQFISTSFWKELVDPTTPSSEDQHDTKNRSRVRDSAIRAIRDGLFSIIPSRCVALTSGNNPSLRERLSDLDVNYVARLERHTTYSILRQSYHDSFWKVVNGFTSVERRMLEQFINPERRNGTKQIETLPTSTTFVLEIADALSDGREHPDSCYPVVVPIDPHLSRLHLPAYSTAQVLRHKLLLAMTNIPFI